MSSTEKKARPKRGGKEGTFIPHETVQEEVKATPKAEEPVEVEVVPDDPAEDEKRKKLEIAKLGVADTAIAQLRAKYDTLTIKGVDDKEGYKLAKQAWQEVRSVRTGLEKKGVQIRSKINELSKAVGKEEDRLVDLISPLEERLQKLWKEIDEEKDRVQKEKEKADQDRLINRINELIGLGMELRDGFYRIGETISMDVATLRALPDEQYEKLKGAVEAKAAEVAEQKRQKEADEQKERDRVAQEQENLRKQQEQIDKDKEELRLARREVRLGKLENLGMVILDDKPEVIAYGDLRLYTAPLLDLSQAEFDSTFAKTKKEIEVRVRQVLRHKRLMELGTELKGTEYIYDNGHKSTTFQLAIITMTDDEEFEKALQEFTGYIAQADEAKVKHEEDKERERVALEAKEKYIAEIMQVEGFGYDYNKKLFFFENDQAKVSVGWNDLLPLAKEEFDLKAQQLGQQVIDLKAKSDKAKKDKEAKEKKDNEAKMGDSQRWELMVTNAIAAAPEPTSFKTKAFQVKAQAYLDWLNNSLKS